MALVNQMIRMRRLEEFVFELVNIHNEEMEDRTLWEIWLHRILDKSFADFKKSISGDASAAPTQADIESTVRESMDILNGFVPIEGLVQEDGTIQAAGNDSD